MKALACAGLFWSVAAAAQMSMTLLPEGKSRLAQPLVIVAPEYPVRELRHEILMAGDASYDERLMLAGRVDGVCADDHICSATLEAIKRFAQDRPTVYLPTHDPQSTFRLANRRLVGDLEAHSAGTR